MDRLRVPLLLAALTLTVLVVAVAMTGDDPAPSTDTTTADPETTTTVATAPGATPAPTPAPTIPPTSGPPPTTDGLAVGEHPICAAWEIFSAESAGVPPQTPDEIRLDNERHLAFYSQAVQLLDGAEREAVAGLLAYHEERAAFWPRWGWDVDAYLLDSFDDPDVPRVPWPTAESADGWRQTLTDRCGLEFVVEDGA